MGVYKVRRSNGYSIFLSYSANGTSHRRTIGFARFSERAELRRLEKEAKLRLAEMRPAILRGTYVEPSTLTVAEFVERTYAKVLRRKGRRTAEREVDRLTKGALGRFFGSSLLVDLKLEGVERFVDMRLNKAGPAAVNRDLARLSHLWNEANKRELVGGVNPVRQHGKLPEDPISHRPLDDDANEEARLLNALESDPIVGALVEVAIHTGIRQGGLLGLRWQDVELVPKRERIQVAKELDKAGRGYTVYPNLRTAEVLRTLKLRSRCTGPEEHVFGKPDGSRMKNVRGAWEAACDRAGIRGLHFHGLRATAATRIQEHGGTIVDAALHLGHTASSMGRFAVTARYTDPNESHRRRIAELTILPAERSAEVTPIAERQAS